MNVRGANDMRFERIAGVVGAVAGLAVIGVGSGARIADLGAASIVPALVGGGALVWLAWRLSALNARAVPGRRPLALVAAGAVGALEVLLIASLVLFCALLSMMALGAGGQWLQLTELTHLLSTTVPGAAAVAAVIGAGWGLAVWLARRR